MREITRPDVLIEQIHNGLLGAPDVENILSQSTCQQVVRDERIVFPPALVGQCAGQRHRIPPSPLLHERQAR